MILLLSIFSKICPQSPKGELRVCNANGVEPSSQPLTETSYLKNFLFITPCFIWGCKGKRHPIPLQNFIAKILNYFFYCLLVL